MAATTEPTESLTLHATIEHSFPGDAWVPFCQTLLWVALIIIMVCRFGRQLNSLFRAVIKRIRDGSSLEAAGFKLGDSPRAAPTQLSEPNDEEDEGVDEDDVIPKVAADIPPPPGLPLKRQVPSDFLAQDLAMRELQQEFGVSISRQVAVGRGGHLDGFFKRSGTGYGVEIKYTTRPLTGSEITGAINRVMASAGSFDTSNWTTIFVEVCDWDEFDKEKELNRIIRHAGVPITFGTKVYVYSMKELQERYLP